MWSPREAFVPPALVKELVEEREFLVKKLDETAAAAASSILWARASLREETSSGVTPGASSPGARSWEEDGGFEKERE